MLFEIIEFVVVSYTCLIFDFVYVYKLQFNLMFQARYLLKNGASPSINQQGNSALACVLRHVRDWEFRYEMLNMLLQEGGDPNIVGRDGSVPLMVCLVPLINKDPLHHFTHNMKVTASSYQIVLLRINYNVFTVER